MDGFTASGLWHATAACPGADAGQSSPDAAYFGVDATCGLDANIEPGELISSPVNLPADGMSAVVFLYRLGNEDGAVAGVASLQISVDGGDFLTPASNTNDSMSVSNSWTSFWLNLSDYAGHTVVLRFRFAPDVTATSGDFGWQIDDLAVTYRYSVEAATDSQGNYSFTDIAPATYGLIAFGPDGWMETAAPATTVTVTNANENLTGHDFGEFEMGRISGQVFSDDNGNGEKDVGEVGLNGFAIELHDGNGQVIATTFSDEDDFNGDGITDPATEAGIYEFAGLAAGSYSLLFQAGEGWTQTTASPGSTSFSGASSGEAATGQWFGAACPAGTICPTPTNPPANPLTNPPMPEVCGDGIDNNGNGSIDEGCPTTPPPPAEVCGDGIDNNNNGSIDEGCTTTPPPPAEVCGDGIDNNLNGSIDEGCTTTPPPPCTPKVRVSDSALGILPDTTPPPTRSVIGKGHDLSPVIQESCGLAVASVSWQFNQSRAVKDYVRNYTEGKAIDLTEADKEKTHLKFYWRNNAIVTVAGIIPIYVTVNFGGLNFATSRAYFEVLGPTVQQFKSRTESVRVTTVNGKPTLVFGNPNSNPAVDGINWWADTLGPEQFSGKLFFTQIGWTETHVYRDKHGNNETTRLFTPGPEWNLDFDPVYSDVGCQKSRPPGGMVVRVGCSDSPNTGLPSNRRKVTRDDKYITYLMYQPSDSPSIPVPIAKLQWSWWGRAWKPANKWMLLVGGNLQHPDGVAINDGSFPEWKGRLQDLQQKYPPF